MTLTELRASLGLGIVFILRMLGILMILPVISTYGLTLKGSSEELIGLAIGVYGLNQLVLQIPFGLLSDRIGRKPVIITGLIFFLLGSIIAANTNNIWGIISGRALQGLCAISSSMLACLSDFVDEKKYTRVMMYIGISFGLSFFVSIVIGPIIANNFGFQSLFRIGSILSIISILVILFLVPSERTNTKLRHNSIKELLNYIISNYTLMKLNISAFCLHTLLVSNFMLFPKQLIITGFALEKHWQVYLLSILTSLIIFSFFIYFIKSKINTTSLVAGIYLLIFSEIIFWSSKDRLLMLILGLQLFLTGFNILEAMIPSLINKLSHLSKGIVMGLYSSSQLLGVTLGGSLGGLMLEYFSIKDISLFNLVIVIIWLVLIKKL